MATCDHAGRVPCASGVCGYSIDGDRCFVPGTDPISDADVGESCAPGDFTYHCAVDDEGFAQGLCDPDSDWLCRKACRSDDDCTAPDTCYGLYFDPAGGMKGFCAPPAPPCLPSGSPCTEHLECCTVLCESSGTCG